MMASKATWYNDPPEEETYADTRTDKQATAINMEYTSSNNLFTIFTIAWCLLVGSTTGSMQC